MINGYANEGAPVRGGMSGAPVLDQETSALVGMVTASNSERGVFQIIPFGLIRRVAENARLLFPIRPRGREEVS